MATPINYVVSSGETSSGITLNLSYITYSYHGYDSMTVLSGGTAIAITVNPDCFLHVSSGGTATNIVAIDWRAGLGITVAPNTYIQGTYDGSAFEMKDAKISGYTVSRGYLYVFSGGTAHFTTVNYDGSLYV